MIVQKYGGSSVGNSERIKNVCNIIKDYYEKSGRKDSSMIVVVSAVGGITDMLINCAKAPTQNEKNELLDEIKKKHFDIIKQLNLDPFIINGLMDSMQAVLLQDHHDKQSMDLVQSFGERLSCRIVSAALDGMGIHSKPHDAFDVGFITNDDFGNAEILPETYQLIKNSLSDFKGVPIVTGFIAKTKKGDITTLGRGGSDYTAAIIGAALDVEEVQIWTDVNGIMTADPRICKDARTVPIVSFAEASELAYFGAKVLHPKTILPVVKKNIPVRILNSFKPSHPGTTVVSHLELKDSNPMKAMAFKRSIQVVNIMSQRMLDAYGFLAKVFDIFGRHKIVVDMIATSEVSISITVDDKVDLSKVVDDLMHFCKVTVERGKSMICIVGERHKYTPGLSAKVFTTLASQNINVEMISQGASEVNLGFVVDSKDFEKAVLILHEKIILKG